LCHFLRRSTRGIYSTYPFRCRLVVANLLQEASGWRSHCMQTGKYTGRQFSSLQGQQTQSGWRFTAKQTGEYASTYSSYKHTILVLAYNPLLLPRQTENLRLEVSTAKQSGVSIQARSPLHCKAVDKYASTY